MTRSPKQQFLIKLATLEVLTSNIDSTKIQEVLEFLLQTSIIINIGESVDILDAIVLNSELLCIHRLCIGMSDIIPISEHYRNVFRVSLGVFFLLYAHTWWLNMVVEVLQLRMMVSKSRMHGVITPDSV